MLELLKDLNSIASEISVFVGLLAGILGILGTSGIVVFSQRTTNTKIGKLLNEYDQKQDERIVKVEKAVEEMKKHLKHDEFRHKLKSKINLSVNSFLDINDDLDGTMQSMITEGSHMAYNFFKDIHQLGYGNISMDSVKRNVLQIFRSLRNNYAGKKDLTEEFADKIKKEAVWPMVDMLITKLLMFKAGHYNGHSDEKFLELSDWFIQELLSRVIALYHKQN